MTEITYRPLVSWPYPSTRDRRGWRTFTAPWDATVRMLTSELNKLDAKDVLVGIVAGDGQITRRDGMLRSDIRPWHPGVEVSFDSRKRRMVYATDVCEDWRHNVRSIALGLEALRAVDRFGITRRGEQYAGFMAISAGGPDPEIGRKLVEAAGSVTEALRKHHPDAGGDAKNFAHVQAFRELVGVPAR